MRLCLARLAKLEQLYTALYQHTTLYRRKKSHTTYWTELRSEPLAGLGAPALAAAAGACFLFFLLFVERERNSEEDAIFERDEEQEKKS